MSPSAQSRDPIDGDLAEPPPSDLSEYTWDDSDTERVRAAARSSLAERAHALGRNRRSATTSTGSSHVLIQTRLVPEPRSARFWRGLLPTATAGAWIRLAAELIRLGKLTPYQAAAIRQGKTKGLLIGDYIVLDKIGSGGMGLVFKARHRQLERIVALKLLPPSFSRDRAAVIRFRREAAAVAKFRHPNIVCGHRGGRNPRLALSGHGVRRRAGPVPDRQREGSALGRAGDRLHHPGGSRPARSS